MARLRILHLVTRSQRRGAEIVALELARQLDALGHDDRVVALAPAFDGSIDPALPPLGVRAHVGASARYSLRRALRRDLESHPADVVLAHGGTPFQIAVGARRGPAPLVVWQRILPFPATMWGLPRRMWWTRLARRGDAAVVLTNELEAELRRLGFRAPIWTVQNFRDAEPFVALDRAAAAGALRVELGIPHDAPVIGLVGHLVEQKRPERVLDVIAGARARGEAAHLVIAGDGPLREQLEHDVATRALTPFVHVLGERRDIPTVLGGIDVLVSTSASEGVPGVLIEALLAGCPVVAMRVGGIATVVEQGVTGLLVEPGAVDAVTERVVELLRDRPRRDAMSAAGRSRAELFSARAAALVYAERFEGLLGGREPKSAATPPV
ncbi:MAG: hypothetical protein JWM72_490 [Actinomycetia bacterium]|jgi:glycosyltransferase involved in cell wall biosynthesis|nr:hypothetical protein [Actinomycetes bacterium]MDQ1461195.1 hypothetical protein [Actinomycetota bacterium]